VAAALGGNWPSRLVATAAEDRLSVKRNIVCGARGRFAYERRAASHRV
jgi:hypothetical protein